MSPAPGSEDAKGYLALVLHAHLPFVRHPEHDVFMEENWLFEAVTETYIPLLWGMERLAYENVPFRLTMSMTPPLVAMLRDPLLQERYDRRINQLVELAEKEIERTKDDPVFNRLAHMYRQRFDGCRHVFNVIYGRDLVAAFGKFQELGSLDIVTCAATHGYLPLMERNPNAVRAQVQVGVEEYIRNFNRPPKGFWLPECAYAPGLDKVLAQFGIKYFLLEAHGIVYGTPRPRFGVYAPIFTPSGVAAFGRDVESSKQVWSAIEGYPGDYEYREFYRDIGYDLDYNYIKPYIHPDGHRIDTGIKYYRITGAVKHKEPYDPERGREKAAEHAGNFVFNREKQVEWLQPGMARKPIIIAPYDAELFGHWWYEGPDWIEMLMRKIAYDQKTVKATTLAEYLEEYPVNQYVRPCASSWGWKGYHEVWLEGSNDWIYRHLHIAADRMVELAEQFKSPSELERRALNQAARELLLAQSSDWAFIMKTGTTVRYAVKRTRDHINRFNRLYHDIRHHTIDEKWLKEVSWRDNIFPQIDYGIYANK